MSQRKYIIDLLTKTYMLGCNLSDNPIEVEQKFEDLEKQVDRETYHRLIGN